MIYKPFLLKKAILTCLKAILICFLLELFLKGSSDPLFTIQWYYIIPATVYAFFAGVGARAKRKLIPEDGGPHADRYTGAHK